MMEDDSPNIETSLIEARLAAEALIVDVDGFEGPLDLLLTMSRTQKVDLRQISVLALAEQYLLFVEKAKELRIELAADYLVMAAWLAFLKSRLLLPPDPTEEGPTGEELAAHLAFQLERLAAMREAAAKLMGRDQLGRDFFMRGIPEDVTRVRAFACRCTADRMTHTCTFAPSAAPWATASFGTSGWRPLTRARTSSTSTTSPTTTWSCSSSRRSGASFAWPRPSARAGCASC